MLSADRNKTVWSKELTQTPSATKLFSQRNKTSEISYGTLRNQTIPQSIWWQSASSAHMYQNRRKNELFNLRKHRYLSTFYGHRVKILILCFIPKRHCLRRNGSAQILLWICRYFDGFRLSDMDQFSTIYVNAPDSGYAYGES